MTAPAKRHLRLIHSAQADVIDLPAPRAAVPYNPLLHHVLRLIPQAITRCGEHITIGGDTAPLSVRVGVAQAVRDGLARWQPSGDGSHIALYTKAGRDVLQEWDRTHPARPDTTPGGDAA